jgi:hypothetical protein
MKAKAVAQACDNANKRRSLIEEKLGVGLKATGFSSGPVLQTMNSESARKYYGNYRSSPKADLITSGTRAEPEPAGVADAGEDVSSFREMIYTVAVTIQYRVEGKSDK